MGLFWELWELKKTTKGLTHRFAMTAKPKAYEPQCCGPLPTFFCEVSAPTSPLVYALV